MQTQKLITILILTMLLIPIAIAATEIEISTDNTTWTDITSTKYGGSIDDTNKQANIMLLNASTTYYIRSRNDTANWNYSTIHTKDGGINQMILTVGLIFIFFTALIVLALVLAKQIWLKTVLGLALSFMIMTLLRFSSWFVEINNPSEVEFINTLQHYFQWGVWGFIIMLIGSLLVVVVLIVNSMNTKKHKKKGWEDWGND